MEELRGEVHRLNGCLQATTREKDQALSDLGALREALLSQQQQSARKVGYWQLLFACNCSNTGTLVHYVAWRLPDALS